MAALNVIIADDEPLAISNLKAKLAAYPNLEIVASFRLKMHKQTTN